MQKSITREVTIYTYKYAHVDAKSMEIHDVVEHESPTRLGSRTIASIGKRLDGRICISSESITRKYELPLDRFIAACKAYADEFTDGTDNTAADLTSDNTGNVE